MLRLIANNEEILIDFPHVCAHRLSREVLNNSRLVSKN